MVASVYDLDVYKRAYQNALILHKLTADFPKAEQFSMTSQIRRASKSICANLAEGFAKGHKSPGEFKRYGLIALGSAEEMMVWLDFCCDLELLPPADKGKWKDEYKIICKQLNNLIDRWE